MEAVAFYDFCLKLGVAGGCLAALVYLVRWMVSAMLTNFDKHITEIVGAINHLSGRVDGVEEDVAEIKDALGIPPRRLRVFVPGDEPDPAA